MKSLWKYLSAKNAIFICVCLLIVFHQFFNRQQFYAKEYAEEMLNNMLSHISLKNLTDKKFPYYEDNYDGAIVTAGMQNVEQLFKKDFHHGITCSEHTDLDSNHEEKIQNKIWYYNNSEKNEKRRGKIGYRISTLNRSFDVTYFFKEIEVWSIAQNKWIKNNDSAMKEVLITYNCSASSVYQLKPVCGLSFLDNHLDKYTPAKELSCASFAPNISK